MAFYGGKRASQAREGYWFIPKQFGIGATPVTWQGWAMTFGFVTALLLDVRFIDTLVPKIIIGVTLLAALLVISWRKTDGDWSWRWGTRG
jgi:hypothetical protein